MGIRIYQCYSHMNEKMYYLRPLGAKGVAKCTHSVDKQNCQVYGVSQIFQKISG